MIETKLASFLIEVKFTNIKLIFLKCKIQWCLFSTVILFVTVKFPNIFFIKRTLPIY